jgi:DNA adenine methylase
LPTRQTKKPYIKPFLKWAGGKYRVLDKLKPSLPKAECLIEPFLGSGAVFINTDYDHYKLNDINPDVINFYRALKTHKEDFIDSCNSLFIPENNSKDRFIEMREEFNNTTEDDLRRQQLFLYLNRHCYNGLCRYNLSGIFNVPFGSYKKPYFPRVELSTFAKKLERAELYNDDFSVVMSEANENCVIYCDPPYIPLNDTAYFTSYTKAGFSHHQQQNLVEASLKAMNTGANVIISNHYNQASLNLYSAARLRKIYVKRSISCNGKKRKQVAEVIAHYQSS